MQIGLEVHHGAIAWLIARRHCLCTACALIVLEMALDLVGLLGPGLIGPLRPPHPDAGVRRPYPLFALDADGGPGGVPSGFRRPEQTDKAALESRQQAPDASLTRASPVVRPPARRTRRIWSTAGAPPKQNLTMRSASSSAVITAAA